MVERRITPSDIIELDYEGVAASLVEFTRSILDRANADGVVVGVSGGVDSATVLALMVKSIGRDRVLALLMPDSAVTPPEDIKDALELVERFDVSYKTIDIRPIVDSYLAAAGETPDRKSLGNLRARIRMSLLYLYANMENRLVAGTGDRSEILIGYFTKYGDGAVDFLPIGCLYKSQVRMLARHLGVPERIAKKPSSPRLWPGQLAETEIGIPYEEVDLILYGLFDLGLSPDEVVDAAGVEPWKVERVLELHRASEHKRQPPPAPDPREHVWRYRRRSLEEEPA